MSEQKNGRSLEILKTALQAAAILVTIWIYNATVGAGAEKAMWEQINASKEKISALESVLTRIDERSLLMNNSVNEIKQDLRDVKQQVNTLR